MADKLDAEIAEEIRRIAGTDGTGRFPIMSGKIKTVDAAKAVCTVELTVKYDGSVESVTPGVRLNVIEANGLGILAVPSVGADCEVAEIDGIGSWSLARASKYDKVVITASSLIQFNDGSLGGLVEIEKLKDNLKAIHDYVKNTLEPAIKNAFTAVGAGSGASGPNGATSLNASLAGQDISYENMENTKVKHGV